MKESNEQLDIISEPGWRYDERDLNKLAEALISLYAEGKQEPDEETSEVQ